ALEAPSEIVASVHIRVVEKSLPADRGTRLLEVSAHYDRDVVREALGEREEPFRVGARRLLRMERTRSNDGDQRPAAGVETLGDARAGLLHPSAGGRGERVGLPELAGTRKAGPFGLGSWAQDRGRMHGSWLVFREAKAAKAKTPRPLARGSLRLGIANDSALAP